MFALKIALKNWKTWFQLRSRFARNVMVVLGANVVAQALPVLAAPLLTRLYTPSDFGAVALFASALSMALAVATARFDWSIPNARSSTTAAALMLLGLFMLAICTLLIALVWVWAPSKWGMLETFGWLLPLTMLGAGAQQLLQAWHVRNATLPSVGRAKVAQSIANVGVSIAAAGAGFWGLVAGVFVGAWVGLGPLWKGANGLPAALRRLTVKRITVALHRFRHEAAWSTLASAVNTASFAVVPLMLARHYSIAEVGYYALMQRVALGPISLVGSAVSQSFWAEAARLVRQDPSALEQLYRRNTVRLAWASLPLALVALAAPLYIGPLFGTAQWDGAGWILAASIPMLVGQTAISPLSHLIIHGKQHWQAVWDVTRVLLLLATIEGAATLGATFVTTVLLLSTTMALMYAMLMLMNLRALHLAQRI